MVLNRIRKLPPGYSKVRYGNKIYGVTRSDFNEGKSIKINAEELGETDVVSLNYYITASSEMLKPCELRKEKVIHFLRNYTLEV